MKKLLEENASFFSLRARSARNNTKLQLPTTAPAKPQRTLQTTAPKENMR